MTEEQAIDRLWGYLVLGQGPTRADVVIALGSVDEEVAEYASRLCLEGVGQVLVVSGRGGTSYAKRKLDFGWKESTEAERFASIALRNGLLPDRLLVEEEASNTGENARYSYDLLVRRGIKVTSVVTVQMPYRERRVLATFQKQWPDAATKISVSSPPLNYQQCVDARPKVEILNKMVGDLQRLKEYPGLGYLTEQDIPSDVHQAYAILIELGYGGRLIETRD